MSLKRCQKPTVGVCKQWGCSEENGTNKLKLTVSLRDPQDKGTCVNTVPTAELHHLLVTVHSRNSSASGKQLSREQFLPDTAPFIGDLLVNTTEQHCLLNLSDDLMIFAPTFLCQPHKPPLAPTN